MNNNRNKKIILGLIILTVIFTMMGGSLAYLSWVSSEAQKTNITFATGVDFSCSADGGGNITEDDAILVPTEVNNNTSSNYIKREVKVTPTITGKNMNISLDLWLDINKLDSGLSTSENVRYALTTSSNSNSEGVVTVGTFHGMQANEKIELLSNEIYSITTTNTYYLWIWIDAAQTTLETAGQKINLSLNGTCSMTPSIVSNTVSNINNHNNDTVEVLLSNPNDYDIGAVISYEDEILKDDITVPAETEDMAVEVYVTESVVRKAAASGTNYLTVTVLDNGRETKYNTNAAFTKTIHYLHISNDSTMTFFGQTFDKSTIKSITFVDNNIVPNDAIGSMDVSAEGNGSIMAWYYKASDYTDDNNLYDFYIGSSNGIVYAHQNSNFAFEHLTNLVKIDLKYYDTSNVTKMWKMFQNCQKLLVLDLSNFDTSKVTDMGHMFRDCGSLSSLDISSFNTSNVTIMTYMFWCCGSLVTLDLSNFNTSKVTTMSSMFYYCSSLTKVNLSSFDTSNVISMDSMFYYCANLIELNLLSFNTSNVTNMANMFYNCSKLVNLDLSNFDTSNVTTMYGMFNNCQKLTSLDLSSFNTSKVNNMQYMFYNCNNLTNINVSNFNTSNVTNMSNMFQNCNNLLSLDLSSFDTSKVNNMQYMFYNCNNLTNINVSNFDTSKVTSMSAMFRGCASMKELNISNFVTSNVTNMWYMFFGCDNLKKLNIKNFDFTNVTDMSSMFTYVPTNIEITVGNTTAKEWLNTNFSSYKNIIIDNK